MRESSLDNVDYLFLRIYSMDLQTAMQSLAALDRCVDPAVRMCIIRDIIVIYCRPFAGNREAEAERSKHRLDQVLPRVIPERHAALHLELKRLRNKLFAHSDLDAYGPTAGMWDGKDGPAFPMSFTGLYHEDLNERLPEIRDLVQTVETAVNNEIRAVHSTFLSRAADQDG